MEFYIGQTFNGYPPPKAIVWVNSHNCKLEQNGSIYTIVENPAPAITVEDYDAALEQHILETRVARGYTTREPSYYLQSSVPRWKQDAVDWVAFIDECMLYGLEVQNRYAEGLKVPTLEEFKAGLPECVWSFEG